jgi:hypothetical protein
MVVHFELAMVKYILFGFVAAGRDVWTLISQKFKIDSRQSCTR